MRNLFQDTSVPSLLLENRKLLKMKDRRKSILRYEMNGNVEMSIR